MIYIVTAMYTEAKPIIEMYKLKKNISNREFQVFESKNISLIISGVGKLNSAVATTQLISCKNIREEDVILNIGICGTNKTDFLIGDIFYINKITDHDSKRNYFPDILFRHNFREASIETFSQIVKDKNTMKVPLCDMESSGFYFSASKYFSPHQIFLLKVISDRLTEYIQNVKVSDLIQKHLLDIDKFINEVFRCIKTDKHEIDTQIVDDLSINLKLTESQKYILQDQYRKYILRNKSEPDIKEYKQIKVETKDERKKHFTKLKQLLSK